MCSLAAPSVLHRCCHTENSMPEYANTMPRVCEQYAYTMPVAKNADMNSNK